MQAIKWWMKAAAANHAKAQFKLGLAYAEGKGVEKDSVQAFRWYPINQACTLNRVKTMFMYLLGFPERLIKDTCPRTSTVALLITPEMEPRKIMKRRKRCMKRRP